MTTKKDLGIRDALRTVAAEPVVKKKRGGRKKGSKNKPKNIDAIEEMRKATIKLTKPFKMGPVVKKFKSAQSKVSGSSRIGKADHVFKEMKTQEAELFDISQNTPFNPKRGASLSSPFKSSIVVKIGPKKSTRTFVNSVTIMKSGAQITPEMASKAKLGKKDMGKYADADPTKSFKKVTATNKGMKESQLKPQDFIKRDPGRKFSAAEQFERQLKMESNSIYGIPKNKEEYDAQIKHNSEIASKAREFVKFQKMISAYKNWGDLVFKSDNTSAVRFTDSHLAAISAIIEMRRSKVIKTGMGVKTVPDVTLTDTMRLDALMLENAALKRCVTELTETCMDLTNVTQTMQAYSKKQNLVHMHSDYVAMKLNEMYESLVGKNMGPRRMSLVKLNEDSINKKFRNTLPFKKGQVLVFMGEIPNMPGRCILMDVKSTQFVNGYRTANFIELKEN